MKSQIVIPACLLLLWTLAGAEIVPEVKPAQGGIRLSCGKGNKIEDIKGGPPTESLTLSYRDDHTGEYTCVSVSESVEKSMIFVKFRTCDNCIELDTGAIVGMAVGNVVATIVVGVAVYLVASQSRNGPVTSNKKSSDRQHLVPNEERGRASNDHYQPLKPKGGQKDTYDVLTNRR
ncbi:T-cell surface glycoprotein CD3 delta chain-like isoform X1 [Cheilinus undulatus]|uniref:T-cell surface glycoprotein CD3 delta chain-like isoform X1 n=1 Tax=Cheilinus undulatus TaxID=241271 RepID=UPI001BD5F6F3|nr:T-cell surface glycoprotein CD3 delta chain-like isoform X1 [Cheilinus undulatus]